MREFLRAIGGMSIADFRRLASKLCGSFSADHEVAWWESTIAIDRVLRQCRRKRQASMAALTATRVVREAAERQGLTHDDADVPCVAHAAATVVRGLVAGKPAERETTLLLGPWAGLIDEAGDERQRRDVRAACARRSWSSPRLLPGQWRPGQSG